MCKEVCILLSHLMSSPHIARVSVVGLRAGTASFSMATATKTLGENLCMHQDALALHCSNYLAWIDNQVGREAGKKSIFINEEKIKFKFLSVNQTCSMLAKCGFESSAKGGGSV